MVAPAAANLGQPPRTAFAHKPARPGQRLRAPVVRLDVGLDAVELELPKGVPQHQPQSFAHQSTAGVRHERVIAHGAALEISADDVVQIDDAHEVAGLALDDEKAVVRAGGKAFEVFAKGGARPGLGRNPVAMERAAPADGGQKGGAVAGLRRPDEGAGFGGAGQFIFSSVWLLIFVPRCRRENQFHAWAVRAAVEADPERP